MEDLAIKVDGVSKTFKLPHEKTTSVKSTLINFSRHKKYEMQRALNNVSFEVKRGEFFGIIGRNGSGKSTMLKMLAGIYVPTKGNIQVNGKLTPFIELGVGFNPELTGRDNVFLNGALLGFNRREMQSMYNDIVEFAELGKFMDQKLKNYSSGMQVRLAFSIAIRAQSDILLIDEVLAVGDEAFQRKCLDIFEQYKASGRTIVLVTHDMDTVRQYCNRAMLINDGQLLEIGNPRSVSEKYSRINEAITEKTVRQDNVRLSESHYLDVKIRDSKAAQKESFEAGETAVFDISFKGLDEASIESLGLNIFKLSGEHVTGINTRDSLDLKNWKDKGRLELELKLDLNGGKYYLLIEIFKEEGIAIDKLEGLQFMVKENTAKWSGLVKLPYKWRETKQ